MRYNHVHRYLLCDDMYLTVSQKTCRPTMIPRPWNKSTIRGPRLDARSRTIMNGSPGFHDGSLLDGSRIVLINIFSPVFLSRHIDVRRTRRGR